MSKTSRSLILLALLVLFAAPLFAGSVTVTWDRNTESDVVGYTVVYGTQSGVYTFTKSVGNVTTWTADNLTGGQTYYFAVQAVNTDGLTSPLSQEASAAVPTTGDTSGGSSGGTSGGTTGSCGPTAKLSSFSASPAPPVTSNTPITWTAAAACGASPLQYKFWLLNVSSAQWTILQDYAASDHVTWTPTAAGSYQLQVWVRSNAVTTSYEDWKSSGYFTIAPDRPSAPPQIATFTADRAFPVGPGTVTRLTTEALGGSASLEYKFWLYTEATNAWTVLQEYGATNNTVWTPTASGRYKLQTWVRRTGSSAPWEAWKALDGLLVQGDVTIAGLTANVGLPVTTNTPITWTVSAGGGSGSLEYQFWLDNLTTQTWTVVQDYSANNQLRWTPTMTGTYVIQARVRIQGATVPWQQWRNTEAFCITGTPVAVSGFQANQTFPVGAGTPITWTATASGGTQPLNYQFWLNDMTAGSWTVIQPFGTSNQLTWTPATNGTYRLQVWVRSQGLAAAYEAWQGTPVFQVTSIPLVVSSFVPDRTLPSPAGSPLQWTATATGNGPLEYQFWLNNLAAGTWTIMQPYGASNRLSWTPAASGTYSMQVWVREAGSNRAYDGWKGTGQFTIR